MAVVGIDIGGTFTDLVYLDARTGALTVDKVSSRPGELHEGISMGFASLRERHGVDFRDVTTVVHGTTVATNAVLEHQLPPTVLLVTRGFGDILEIGTMLRPSLYDLRVRKASTLVPRHAVIEVAERIGADGIVAEALDEAEIERISEVVAAQAPVAVAICFLFSFMNAAHERAMASALRAAFPNRPVSLSADVDPQPREYPRANTTILNASLNPLLVDYIAKFRHVLDAIDGEQALYVMQSDGRLIEPDAVARNAHRLVLSGPAGGVVAAVRILADCGYPNLITFDVGGTSTDLCLVVDGQASLSLAPSPHDLRPIRTASLGVHAVGAGGGSIASVDQDGMMSVGPRSAGSTPGPVCYKRGGTSPTVTDAQMVLGRLSPAGLLGGDMPLDREAAAESIRRQIAEPLGLSLEAAACAIIDVAVATMERGLRVVSVNAGYDPRAFALVAYGGGGPLHAVDLATAVGIGRVIVPPASSAFSALGLLCADRAEEHAQAIMQPLAKLSGTGIAERFRGLEERIDLRASGEDVTQRRRFADLRFVGQNGVMRVPVDAEARPETLLAQMAGLFLAEHRREFGHASDTDPIELASIRVVATTRTWSGDGLTLREPDVEAPALPARPVFFTGTGWINCPIVARSAMRRLGDLNGPAIIEDRESTSVVPPGHHVRSDGRGSLIIEALP